MDQHPHFRQYFDLITAGAPPSDEPVPAAFRRPGSLGNIPDVPALLSHLVDAQGTQFLNRSELALLRDRSNRSAILEQASLRNTDPRVRLFLQRSAPPQSTPAIPYLLVAVQAPLIRFIVAKAEAALAKFKLIVTLRALIDRHSLQRGPERDLLAQLVRAAPNERTYVIGLLDRLTTQAKQFEVTYQYFANSRVNGLVELKFDWHEQLRNSVAMSPPPTDRELFSGQRLMILETVEIPTTQTLIEQLTARLRELAGQAASRERTEGMREVRAARTALQLRLPDMRAERRARRQALGRRLEAVTQFLNLRAHGSHSSAVENRRRALLDEHTQIAAGVSNLPLVPGPATANSEDDNERWRVYERLLQSLIDGDTNVSIEFLIDVFLRNYRAANRIVNIAGLPEVGGASTYTGHGDNAIDLNAGAGTPVRFLAGPMFALPRRFVLTSPGPVAWGPFRLTRTEVKAEDIRVTSDCHDILFKIASGLLRKKGQRGIGRTLIAELMDAEGHTALAPEYVSDRQQQNFDPALILDGLGYTRLAENENAGPVDSQRAQILRDIETFVRQALRAPEGQRIFRESDRLADRGQVGARRLIVFGSARSVFAQIKEMLRLQSGRDNPDGLPHRLWRLLWDLKVQCGPPAVGAGGSSVTVAHTYASMVTGQPDLTIRILHSHMHAIAVRPGRFSPSDSIAGVPLGLVGMTGNAGGSHLHMHIELCAGQTTTSFGAIFPHEFFPIAREF